MQKRRHNYWRFWLTVLAVFVINIAYNRLNNTIGSKTWFFNPERSFFKGFDFTDIYYHLHDRNVTSGNADEIVVVNAHCANASKISGLIDSISLCKPGVIGLDYMFDDNTASDDGVSGKNCLSEALGITHKVVVGFDLDEVRKKGRDLDDSLVPATKIFAGRNAVGYVGFNYGAGVIRSVLLNQYYGQHLYRSFGLAIAEKYLGKEDDRIVALSNDTMPYIIEYIPAGSFKVLNGDSILMHPRAFDSLLEGNVVLLGEFGDSAARCGSNDKHFTPFNEQMFGKSFPDMYGIFIHANIVHSVISGAHIRILPDASVYFITMLLCLPLLAGFILVYRRAHLVYHIIEIILYELLLYWAVMTFSVWEYGRSIYINSEIPYNILSILPFMPYLAHGIELLLKKLTRMKFNSYLIKKEKHIVGNKNSQNEH